MILEAEQNHWKAIYKLFPLYDAKNPGRDLTLVLYSDLSGHLSVGDDDQIASFDNLRQLAQWLHMAMYDPTSVGVHSFTETETIAKRVPLDELEELLYAIIEQDETVDLYREDLGTITIGYNAENGLWYADSQKETTDLSRQFTLSILIDDVMDILSETAREYA